MRGRRPAGRRTRPRRHPARPGRAGTGPPGRRTSAAARTPAGSARASRRPAPLVLQQGPVAGELVQVHQHRHAFPRSAADDCGRDRQSSGNGRRRHFPGFRPTVTTDSCQRCAHEVPTPGVKTELRRGETIACPNGVRYRVFTPAERASQTYGAYRIRADEVHNTDCCPAVARTSRYAGRGGQEWAGLRALPRSCGRHGGAPPGIAVSCWVTERSRRHRHEVFFPGTVSVLPSSGVPTGGRWRAAGGSGPAWPPAVSCPRTSASACRHRPGRR